MDWLLPHPHLFYSRLSSYHLVYRACCFAIRIASLSLALLLLTACDSREEIAVQLVEDKQAVHELLSKTNGALCGRYPGPPARHYSARKKNLPHYFSSTLIDPAMDFVRDSHPHCYFPDAVDDSIYIDGSRAAAVIYSSSDSSYVIPVELKLDWAGKWHISAINFELVLQYLKTNQYPPSFTLQIEETKKLALAQEAKYPAQLAAEKQPDTVWDKVIKWILYLLKGLAILLAIIVFILWRYAVMGGHRAFKTQCQKDAILIKMSAEFWPLAVGAPYAIVSNYNWSTVTAAADAAQAAEDKRDAIDALASAWGVNSRSSLLSQLFWLFASGHRAEYEEQIASDRNMPEHEYAEYARQLELESKHAPDAKERLWQLNMARKNKRNIGQLDFCAWDMVRFAMLCHSGARAGYLSEQEMQDFLLLAAVELQKHYQSWRDLGQKFLLARWYWKATDKRHLFTHYLFKKAISRLLKQRGSPWKMLEWNSPLPAPISVEQFAMICNQTKALKQMLNDDNVADKSVY